MIQGSPEWFQARCGYATASRFSDVLAKIKTGEAASRRNYRAQLVCERMTGLPAESFESSAMKWGTEQEPYAREAYEIHTGAMIEQVGFLKHADLMAGASPDGLIDEDGGIELKCPNTATHIDTILKGMPAEHLPQIQGAMWITGRGWWDFVSYDPRMPEHLQLFIKRVERDEKYITQLAFEVNTFLADVEEAIAQLSKGAA